jgi:SprT-like family
LLLKLKSSYWITQTKMLTPTTASYPELEEAYNHFNRTLFNNELPAVLITLQRKSSRVMGYFSPDRFVSQSGKKTDELAMNPCHFLRRDPMDTLSTFAHEMVHVWQQHNGKPGRRGYHNKAWGLKMKGVGLYPSNTGKPGGKETGEQMTHYIVPDGLFEVAAAELIRSGFRFSWAEYVETQKIETDPLAGGALVGVVKLKPATGRIKFVCVGCRNKAWGRPSLRLVCADCMKPMVSG